MFISNRQFFGVFFRPMEIFARIIGEGGGGRERETERERERRVVVVGIFGQRIRPPPLHPALRRVWGVVLSSLRRPPGAFFY